MNGLKDSYFLFIWQIRLPLAGASDASCAPRNHNFVPIKVITVNLKLKKCEFSSL
jgi:hypothetical protein